jgi:hypothetical protein
MSYSHEKLICADTGEFDWTFIKRQALLRAQASYGNCAPPVSYVRSEIRNLQGTAAIMRKRWRDAHGLVDDTVYVTIAAYGDHSDGVRRSAF